jgi:hypothetical protein
LDALRRPSEAQADRHEALALVRRASDPTSFLRAASELLRAREDEALQLEAREAARRIIADLPEGDLRRGFEQAAAIGPLLR